MFIVPQNEVKSTTVLEKTKEVNNTSSLAQTNTAEPQSINPSIVKNDSIIANIKSSTSEFQIDSLGRISQVILREAQFLDENHDGLLLLDKSSVKPLEIRFSDEAINKLAFEKNYVADKNFIDVSKNEQKITLIQDLGELTVKKELTFYPDGHYDISVVLSKPFEYFITQGFRPSASVDMLAVHGLLVKEFDDTIEIIEDGDASGFESFRNAKIVSSFDKYYASVFYNNNFDVVVSKIENEDPLGFVKGNSDFKFSGYIGPKLVDVLTNIDPQLKSVVEYGIFTFLAAPLFIFLDYLFGFTGNWGWAIVLLTIIVRVILFPLSAKGMVSMHKMKLLAPKLKEIQQKYKGDNQKLQAHTMELYKKHGANPLGGCLPFLLQIPIFFAIYRVLINAIELKGAEWFYIDDLSLMDPYFIMPVLMGVSMYFQQKITPSNFTDPMQEKIFKYLPVIFTFFFFTFPAGLVLYWFVNNLLSILQQYIINKRLEVKKVEHNDKD